MDEKRKAYAALDAVVGEPAIFCSNTSSLCITELAAATRRPDRFGGLHFFNPVPLMKLVEVVRGLSTTDETYRSVFAFAQSLGKEPITAPDRPGFIVNRLLVPYLLDAVRAYENGLGTLEDIDKGMTLGCGHPMGPFTLLDFVGLDTTYFIANIMFEEFREPAYAPPPLLKRMVLAGPTGQEERPGVFIGIPVSRFSRLPGQYRFFNCRIRSNFAVSATAITAITPAWTGSLTTRSAASGTLPAMFSEITRRPFLRTSSTAAVISPPISAPASTSSLTRGSRAVARTAAASSCSPTSGIVSMEMRSPRMLWRSASAIAPIATMPDLRPAAHDDDALAVDLAEGRRLLGARDAGDRAQVVQHGLAPTSSSSVNSK